MIFLFLFLFWGMTTMITYSQSLEQVIGKKTDGSDLKATCYSFPQRVQTFSTNKDMNYVCLQFRDTTSNGKYIKNKGEIGIYDMTKREMVWTKPLNYANIKPIFLSEGVFLKSISKSSLLDFQTGEERWKCSFFQVYGSDSLGVLLGYNNPKSNKLKAIRLSDGAELWTQKLPHQYGWHEVYNIDVTKRLIVADDIHELDLLTGKMLTHEAKTGVEDVKSALLQGIGAVAMGVVTGIASGGMGYTTFVPTAGNVITDMVSNVLFEDSCYYVADRRCITCLDKQLSVCWSTELPDKKSSHSKLFVYGDKLYMLNFGYALRNGDRKVKNGRPFIACYDKKTGKEIYFNQLTTKKDMIEDAYISDDEAIYMLFDDGLAYQHLTDSVVNNSVWNVEKYGKLEILLGDGVYSYRSDKEDFIHLESSLDYCLVSNDRTDVFEVDKELNVRTEYKAESIYWTYYKLDSYRLIGNGTDFWLIHELGMPVAHLTIDFRYGYAQGNILWLLSTKNELLKMDLDKALL